MRFVISAACGLAAALLGSRFSPGVAVVAGFGVYFLLKYGLLRNMGSGGGRPAG